MTMIKNIRAFVCRVPSLAVLIIGGVLAFAATSRAALADDVLDPLHGVCIPACVDNGTNSPTTSNPTTFGFTVSPGPASGGLMLVFLVPTTGSIPGSISFTGASSGTATLFSATPWNSGQLDTYLGISGSPTNPIGAFAAGGTSFDVFTATIAGTTTLPGPGDPLSSPYWTTAAPGIPINSYILGFFNEGTAAAPNWVATANSGAIFVDGPPGDVVPEPSSLILLGTGALALAGMVRRRYMRRT